MAAHHWQISGFRYRTDQTGILLPRNHRYGVLQLEIYPMPHRPQQRSKVKKFRSGKRFDSSISLSFFQRQSTNGIEF